MNCLAWMAPRDALSVTKRAEVETLLDNPFEYQPLRPHRKMDRIADSLRQAPRLSDFVLHRSPLTPDLFRPGPGLAFPGSATSNKAM